MRISIIWFLLSKNNISDSHTIISFIIQDILDIIVTRTTRSPLSIHGAWSRNQMVLIKVQTSTTQIADIYRRITTILNSS